MVATFILKLVYHLKDERYCVAVPFEQRDDKVNFSF